ncbi:hypothetical protein F5B17DRAFT_430876 [Nemania serpens]|nr:hypothetical protein F5B17DRAFT_430876 [Nemania serpens]
MRRGLTTIVLATSTLLPTGAARLSIATGDGDSTELPWLDSDSNPVLGASEGRAWTRRAHPELGSIRHKKNPWCKSKDDGGSQDDSPNDSEDDDDSDKARRESHPDCTSHHTTSQPSPKSTPVPTISTSKPTSISTTTASSIATFTQMGTHPPSPISSMGPSATSSSPSPAASADETNNSENDDDGGNKPHGAKIAAGVLGGLLLLLVLLFIWYCLVIRPKRRRRLRGERMAPFKDGDIESHINLAIRNEPQTPYNGLHDAGRSSDRLSSHPIPVVPLAVSSTATHATGPVQVVESADRGLSIPLSPDASHFHAEPYLGFSSGPISPIFPTQGVYGQPLPLRIDASSSAHASSEPTAMDLDARSPPPGYPDAIAASQAPRPSPTPALPVSPLSVTSPHPSLHAHAHFATGEPQHEHCQGPRRPSYGDYEASALPEVVSPICQLGQTSASLPEYDSAAETARSDHQHHYYQHQHDHHL